MIHIIDGKTDRILDYIPLGEFWDDWHRKSLKDTLETFDFTTFGDRRYSQHLTKRNRVIIPDDDGRFVEFIIENTHKYRDTNGDIIIKVYTVASYLELTKAKVIEPQTLASQTPSTAVAHALAGTEWVPGNIQGDGTRTFHIEEYTNPYSFTQTIATEFGVERNFRIEHDGNRVTGRFFDLVERIGEWQGREVEFAKDLAGIERKEDMSGIVTALIGLGPEREDGTRLEVFVEDEDALQRWGRPHPQTGQLMHLVETYEPESSDQDMTIERLEELTRNELEKRINSVVEYSADVVDLEKVPGLQNKVIRFGDTIKIKDLGFNPPLYLEARVHTQERSLSDPANKRVILGDFIEYTEEEVQEIWRQLRAQIAKKIEMSDVLEVTYTKPEIDAKDSSVYQDSTQYSDIVSETKKQEAIQVAAVDATQKANQAKQDAIQQSIAEVEQRVNQAKAELENEIATKVDAEWVNGQLVLKENVITKSNTAPTNPTTGQLWLDTSVVPNVLKRWDGSTWVKVTPTAAGEVGAYTKTEVDNALNSKVSIAQYTADMDGVVTRLNSAESRITQNEQEIAAKVSNTTYQQDKTTINNNISQLQTRMSNAEAQLTIQADQIATKVSRTEFESLQIGGRNLLTDTEKTWESTGTASGSTYGIYRNNLNDLFASLVGKEVTFSFDVKIDTTDGTPGQVRMYCTNGNPKYTFPLKIFSGITDQYQRVTYTTTITEIPGNTGQARIEFWGVDSKTTKIYIRRFKLERGNRATDWTPAPEDVDGQISGLNTRVSIAESSITQLADQIALKVEKNGVISAINQTAEQIKIQASRVDLSGYVTFTNLSTPGQTTIDGGNLKTNSVTANKLNVSSLSAISANLGTVTAGTIRGVALEGVTGTFSGHLTSQRLQIGPESPNIPWYENAFLAVEFKNPIRISDGVFTWGDPLRLKVGNNNAIFEGLSVIFTSDVEAGGVLYTDAGAIINANASHIQLIESDNNNKKWHIEVNGGNFNIVETGVATRLQLTTDGGLSINWLHATNDINFSNYTGRLVNDSGNGYLQTSGAEYRVTKYKSTTYIPIRAASFPTGSLAEYKQDIHVWEESALEKIRNTTIYEYRLKSEVEAGKDRWRQGLVIGDGYNTPEGVIDGDGVEQYLMNSWSWKAIQELDSEQQSLKDRIAWLESENDYLRQKIASLEAKMA